jgi:3-oxoacyl-[acyl-carrier protein] reductase
MDQPVALVTGASKGIGRGLVERLLRQGYRVAGCSRGEGSSTPLDGPYEHATVDIRDEARVRAWVTDVGTRHGRIDVLINNAGICPTGLTLMTTGSMAEDVFRTNVIGTLVASREAIRFMIKRKRGRIVNISSIAEAMHMQGTSAYAGSKAAMVEMARVLAREVAAWSITVNVVAPSIVETDMLAKLSPEAVERCRQALAIQRSCTVDDIWGVTGFLISDAASYVTGQVIYLGYVP